MFINIKIKFINDSLFSMFVDFYCLGFVYKRMWFLMIWNILFGWGIFFVFNFDYIGIFIRKFLYLNWVNIGIVLNYMYYLIFIIDIYYYIITNISII